MRRACVLMLCAFATIAAQNRSPQLLGDIVTGIPQLRRSIAINLTGVTIETALREIGRRSELPITYNDRILPKSKTVWLSREEIRTDEALQEVLRGSGLRLLALSTGQVVVVRDPEPVVGTISGTVTEAKTGNPVPQAVISVSGTPFNRATGNDGRYVIPGVSAGDHIVSVKRLGYDPTSRDVTVRDGETAVADFALTAAATRLSEIVTTVTGAQRRVEVGNVIGRITADSLIREAPVMSFSDVLNGRVPGVQVITTNGTTGAPSPRIRIRGINSATVSNNPLLIVDGARIENSAGGLPFDRFGSITGRINDINPQDIDNIEIVKGPSAATLYGTDAANGVIVITTKHGSGKREWRGYFEAGLIKPHTHWGENWYAWGKNTAMGATQQCQNLVRVTGACTLDSVTTYNPLNDPAQSIAGQGDRTRVGLQFAGGNPTGYSYFLSGDREQEVGFLRLSAAEASRIKRERGVSSLPDDQLRPNQLTRNNLRANFGAELGQSSDVTVQLGLGTSAVMNPGFNPYIQAMLGAGTPTINGGWAPGFSADKPGETFAVHSEEDVTHVTGSATWNYQPLDWLSTRATIGTDVSNDFFFELQRRDEGPPRYRTGRRLNEKTNIALQTIDLGITAVRQLSSQLSSRSSVGGQYNRRAQKASQIVGTTLPPGGETVSGAAVLTGNETNLETVVAGSYLEQSVGYLERVFVTAALRADGASAFGKNFQTAIYPKASVSWVAIQNQSEAAWINTLRLRAAHGASGVQPGPVAALALLNPVSALADGATGAGVLLSSIGNTNLKPERQRETEIGMDVDLLGSRAHGEITVYRRRSEDALFNRPLPSSIGVQNRLENIGAISNQGTEIGVSGRILANSYIAWDLSVSGSVNRNRVEKIDPQLQSANLRQGLPLWPNFRRPVTAYSDANGNGVLELNEVTVGDSGVFFGNPIPAKQATLSSTLALFSNRVRINTMFDYRGDFVVNDLAEENRCFRGYCRAMNDPKAPLEDQARWVGLLKANTPWGYFPDGTYTRWREVSLTYDLPAKLQRYLRTSQTSVTLTGRNIAIWTHYPDIDPEITAFSRQDIPGQLEYSIDNFGMPGLPRYWLIRINAGF
jgi:TonB-linked SusC/RagA family outer membrane protein